MMVAYLTLSTLYAGGFDEPEYACRSHDIEDNVTWISCEERTSFYSDIGLPIIEKLARSIPVAGKIDVDEQMSVGNVGFADALNSYKPRYAASFKTWATLNIRNAMLDYNRRMTHRINGSNTVSFDPHVDDNERDETMTLGQFLYDTDIQANIEISVTNHEIYECVMSCINELSERKRNVLLRSVDGLNPYNADHKRETQEQIARDYNKSQALIAKILDKARSDVLTLLYCRYGLTLNDCLTGQFVGEGSTGTRRAGRNRK